MELNCSNVILLVIAIFPASYRELMPRFGGRRLRF